MRRVRLLSTAALAFPLALGAAAVGAPALRAQASDAPAPPRPPANPVVGSFQPIADSFGRRLVAAFDSIPAARYGYRPTAPQQSVGYIAQHLESANYVLCQSLGAAPRMQSAKDALADTVKAGWPKDTLVARLRASLRYCGDAFVALRDEQLGDTVTVGAPGRSGRLLRARALGLFVTDLAEHYAQVASYMRMMGMVPPSAQARPRGQ